MYVVRKNERDSMKTTLCSSCGGLVIDGKQKYHHLKRCVGYKQEGVDHLCCMVCGYKTPMISHHIHIHGMSLEEYRVKYPDCKVVLPSVTEKRRQSLLANGCFKPVSERRGSVQCDKCGDWFIFGGMTKHLQECIVKNPDKYELNKDYVKCPECNQVFLSLSTHLRKEHGWDDEKLHMEHGRGLYLRASKIIDKCIKSTTDKRSFIEINKKREQTVREKYGVDNVFSLPEVQAAMIETSQRRYGTNHPMQNEEIFTRQTDSAHRGPSALEVFFDEHTCEQCVYIGYGGRFIRTKTGVHKYGRLIKDLNPDFIVLSSNVLESALAASKEHRKLSSERHRSRYVIELLGDYYHSKEVIGVDPAEHEKELIAAYRSANIECLVLWENDVMTRWESIRPMVDAWIDKAVKDMNEHPIFSRATKNKVDRRKGDLLVPDGSGKKFRSYKQLDKWLASPLNYWKPGMVEGKDYVVCQECNARVAKATEHIRKSHGMTKEQYLAKYPDATMVSASIGEALRASAAPRGPYVPSIAYRCQDGTIVRKKDAWLRSWSPNQPPQDSIVDGGLYDPWKDKVESVDFVTCKLCGHRAANLSRHIKTHSVSSYDGPLRSQKCIENISAGAYTAWDIRGRKPERDLSQNKTHKQHGLTKEILEQLYVAEALSDAKIGERYGMTGEGIAYQRKKHGIQTRQRVHLAS